MVVHLKSEGIYLHEGTVFPAFPACPPVQGHPQSGTDQSYSTTSSFHFYAYVRWPWPVMSPGPRWQGAATWMQSSCRTWEILGLLPCSTSRHFIQPNAVINKDHNGCYLLSFFVSIFIAGGHTLLLSVAHRGSFSWPSCWYKTFLGGSQTWSETRLTTSILEPAQLCENDLQWRKDRGGEKKNAGEGVTTAAKRSG